MPDWPPSPVRLPRRTPNCGGTSAIWKAALPNVFATVADSLRKSGLSNGEIAPSVTRERAKFKRQIDKKRDELRKSDQQIDRLFKESAGQTLVQALS